MPAVSRMRLHHLAEREFKREANSPVATPAPRHFRGMRVSLSQYDPTWDRKRGRAARLMAVLLRESDEQLTQRVCETAASCKTYRGAAEWLSSEARYLRKLASKMDTATARLSVALDRCQQPAEPATSEEAQS